MIIERDNPKRRGNARDPSIETLPSRAERVILSFPMTSLSASKPYIGHSDEIPSGSTFTTESPALLRLGWRFYKLFVLYF
jgi:hypothetical protein